MNILARLFRPFYSVEKRSSLDQLQNDFGEFPPAPLQCESLTGNFNVVRASGIGHIYHDLMVQSLVLEADIDSLSTDLVASLGADKLRDLQRVFENLGPRSSRFLMRVVVVWMFIVRTAKAIRHKTINPKSHGVFVPYFKDGLQIVINSQKHFNKSEAPTISHEHIHLLQHRNPETHCRHVRAPQELLTEEGCADLFILYVLQKMEVEARLHESVLSFYRAYRYLPTTVSGFLELLAASEAIGGMVTRILQSDGITFLQGQDVYPERESRPVEHLGWILLDMRTPELQRRYITEVLPVMYCNLLKYYGDDVASRCLLQAIDRPNFYDELYAAQPPDCDT